MEATTIIYFIIFIIIFIIITLLFRLSRKKNARIGPMNSTLKRISQKLAKFQLDTIENELFPYVLSQPRTKEIIDRHDVTPNCMRRIYCDLIKSGASGWHGGHYISASALAYPETLDFLIKNGVNKYTAFSIIMYFECGLPLCSVQTTKTNNISHSEADLPSPQQLYENSLKYYEGNEETKNLQYNLGVMYAQGRGVPKDERKAVELYQKAADQGFAWAQNNLARMYEQGRGVPKDERKTVELFQKAADQGFAGAQYELALRRYLQSYGVPQG
jgi:preprotein translocase subunit SecG